MLSIGAYNDALGAALLLAVNVVCINLSSKLVFLFRGIKPRTWLEAHKAKQSRLLYISAWLVTLALLFFMIYLKHNERLHEIDQLRDAQKTVSIIGDSDAINKDLKIMFTYPY